MPSNLPASPLFHRGDYSGGSGRSAPARNTAGSGTTQPPAPSPAASPTTRKSLCDSLCRFMAGGQSQPHCAPCPSRPIWASSCLSRDSSLNKKLVIGPEGSEQGTLRHALPWNPPCLLWVLQDSTTARVGGDPAQGRGTTSCSPKKPGAGSHLIRGPTCPGPGPRPAP